jgi:cytochrome c-type biogenesis protein CcmH
MKKILILLAILWATPLLAIHPQQFDSPEQEARYQELIKELRCLVCQNQNIADSNAGLAKDLRDIVLEKIKSGMSDEEIRIFLLDRYGDFVLYNPPVKSGTAALWFGPGVLLVIGAIVLVVALKRRTVTDDLTPDPEQEELDRRLAELEKLDQ